MDLTQTYTNFDASHCFCLYLRIAAHLTPLPELRVILCKDEEGVLNS